MIITIPAGTTLIADNGVPMYVEAESTAEVIDVAYTVLAIRLDDGQEYTVTARELGAQRAIYINPGNNVVRRNGKRVQ